MTIFNFISILLHVHENVHIVGDQSTYMTMQEMVFSYGHKISSYAKNILGFSKNLH